MKKLLLIILILLTLLSPGFTAVYVDPIDSLPKPKTLAMGNTYVGQGKGIYAGFYNPAGLTDINTLEFSAINTSTFRDEQLSSLSLANKFLAGTFFIGYTGINVGDLKNYAYVNNQPAEIGNISYQNSVISLGYGQQLNSKLSAGILLKNYQHILNVTQGSNDGFNGQGNGLDLGLQYKLTNKTTFGLTYKNALGNDIVYGNGVRDELQKTMVIGLGQKTRILNKDIKLGFDHEIQENGLKASLSRFGFELDILKNVLQLRGGATQVPQSNGKTYDVVLHNTLGLGLKLGKFELDYAYYPQFRESTAQHFFGFTFSAELENFSHVEKIDYPRQAEEEYPVLSQEEIAYWQEFWN
jgi:hypothetical protein